MNMLQAESMSLVCLWHINVHPGSLTTIISLVSKARRKFGDKVLAFKLRCVPGQLTSFPLVIISTAVRRSRVS